MNSAREKDIRDKLFNFWKKEAIRVTNLPNGWVEKRVTLGRCYIKIQGTTPERIMLNKIEDFGIDLHDFQSMKPSYDDIYEVYQAITAYRVAVRYLKDLKQHMSTFQEFKRWRD